MKIAFSVFCLEMKHLRNLKLQNVSEKATMNVAYAESYTLIMVMSLTQILTSLCLIMQHVVKFYKPYQSHHYAVHVPSFLVKLLLVHS